MRFKVLGCSGGSAPGRQPTSFLLDDVVAIDGGAVTSALGERAQERIDHVVLSHAHLDHVANVPFLLDNRFVRQTRPLTLHAGARTLAALKDGLFNDKVWPDFTALRNAKSVALELHEVTAAEPFPVAHLRFTAHPMVHPIPCFGYLVEDAGAAIFVAGDTGAVAPVKAAAARAPRLQAIVIECSWPDRMRRVAEEVGHLVPSMLAEAWPLHPTARVLITHVKPFYLEEVLGELSRLALPGSIVLEDGMAFEF